MADEVKQSEAEPRAYGFLIGRFEHALDPKRRLTIPALWRAQMGLPDSLYVLPSPRERMLCLVPPEQMAAHLERVRRLALADPARNRSWRALCENSEQVVLDVQGRVRIRDRLLAFAQLSDKVVLVGQGKFVELWSPEQRPEAREVPQEALAGAWEELFGGA